MQLNCEPDGIRIRIVAVPRIGPLIFASHSAEGIVGVTNRHDYIFIQGGFITLVELLHTSEPVDLGMHFKEWVLIVNEAIRVAWRPPEVQF